MEAPLVFRHVRTPALKWAGRLTNANQIQKDRFPSSEVNGCTRNVPFLSRGADW
jgi:hypothetical protein